MGPCKSVLGGLKTGEGTGGAGRPDSGGSGRQRRGAQGEEGRGNLELPLGGFGAARGSLWQRLRV